MTNTETTTEYESKLMFNSVSDETLGSYWCTIVNMPGQMTDISTSLIEIGMMGRLNSNQANFKRKFRTFIRD